MTAPVASHPDRRPPRPKTVSRWALNHQVRPRCIRPARSPEHVSGAVDADVLQAQRLERLAECLRAPAFLERRRGDLAEPNLLLEQLRLSPRDSVERRTSPTALAAAGCRFPSDGVLSGTASSRAERRTSSEEGKRYQDGGAWLDIVVQLCSVSRFAGWTLRVSLARSQQRKLESRKLGAIQLLVSMIQAVTVFDTPCVTVTVTGIRRRITSDVVQKQAEIVGALSRASSSQGHASRSELCGTGIAQCRCWGSA